MRAENKGLKSPKQHRFQAVSDVRRLLPLRLVLARFPIMTAIYALLQHSILALNQHTTNTSHAFSSPRWITKHVSKTILNTVGAQKSVYLGWGIGAQVLFLAFRGKYCMF
jgi:hypothetical protein